MLTDKQQAKAAAEFAERWKGKGYEKGDSQVFWMELLTEVYGVKNISEFIRYEEQVKVDATNFIDGHIPSTKVLIEQKSIDKDLRLPVLQSDGSKLNPFQQAKRYVANMPLSEHPRWVVTCNFAEFLVYDMEQPNGEPEQILLENLGKEYYRLQFLVNEKSEHIKKEEQVSMQAGEIVGRIHEALLKQYNDSSAEAQRWLNILCVRIVFCLYAEDAGIFAHDQFYNYLVRYEADDFRNALLRLFEVLNTPIEKRSKYMKDDLKAFPYTNGGLFEEEIEIPQFTEELKQILLHNASLDFDWSEISPTIFGAVFESTLNPETRRSGGMHYTSIENIHKVIDPLFMNDLKREFDTILEEKVERQRNRKLEAFQDKLSKLTFLDPACGSGNFLTETYLSLRRLENDVIRERHHGQAFIGFEEVSPIKVSINQFYGIEINDFAVTVATTALWISESQMLTETERIINKDIDFLPLKSYANIKEGNALLENWNLVECPNGLPEKLLPGTIPAYFPNTQSGTFLATLADKSEDMKEWKHGLLVQYNYIMGNPPFIGARNMSKEQKDDVLRIFGEKWKNVGNLDYVCCWYKKAFDARWIGDARIAFVSTNSICQGEQVANLWKPLMKKGLCIDFAHRTFRWDSEASIKAHVHCVIVGFSKKEGQPLEEQTYYPGVTSLSKPKYDALEDTKEGLIFDNDKITKAKNINAYLLDAPNVFIESRVVPLCDVPWIKIGNLPIDGGNYLFTYEEMLDFAETEPLSEQYFHPWYGSEEFIHRKPRYCLWLGNCSPAELRNMPHCMKRIEAVREMRLSSNRAGTRKLADYPTRFSTENMPDTNFIIIPKVSSERRRYVPMGFMSPEVLASDLVFILPDASLYHFGVLESNVHMAWMRVVCGRLKSDYRYSKDIVYNNFPWPNPTEEQQEKIAQTAQAILDARALYPDSSLADLYDEAVMPVELRKAHQANDKAVLEAYGFPPSYANEESKIVSKLFKLYQQLTSI